MSFKWHLFPYRHTLVKQPNGTWFRSRSLKGRACKNRSRYSWRKSSIQSYRGWRWPEVERNRALFTKEQSTDESFLGIPLPARGRDRVFSSNFARICPILEGPPCFRGWPVWIRGESPYSTGWRLPSLKHRVVLLLTDFFWIKVSTLDLAWY